MPMNTLESKMSIDSEKLIAACYAQSNSPSNASISSEIIAEAINNQKANQISKARVEKYTFFLIESVVIFAAILVIVVDVLDNISIFRDVKEKEKKNFYKLLFLIARIICWIYLFCELVKKIKERYDTINNCTLLEFDDIKNIIGLWKSYKFNYTQDNIETMLFVQKDNIKTKKKNSTIGLSTITNAINSTNTNMVNGFISLAEKIEDMDGKIEDIRVVMSRTNKKNDFMFKAILQALKKNEVDIQAIVEESNIYADMNDEKH